MATLTCVNCRQPLAPGADICEHCGAILPQAANPISKVSSSSVCPSCQSPLAPGEDICDHCGAVIAQTANFISKVSSPSVCPSCQSPLTPGEDICEHCGAVITPGATPPPSKQPAPAEPLPIPAAELEKCPRCGAPSKAGKKFCGKCGYQYPLQQEQITQGSVLGGKYRLEKVIGSGGMGAVYLAEDLILKRKVVIKALLNNDDPDMVAQSVKEREFLAAIKHSNIVAIYDFIAQGSQGYIVMEYVHGKTLDQLLNEYGGPLDVLTGIRHILNILPAFAYLAKLSLVYCDFKPQNVMLEVLKDGTQIAKLIDLGTVIKYGPKPERVYGTHGFYARQAVKSPSPETDLYSVCRTLAYLITLMDTDDPLFGMPPAEKYQVFLDNPPLYRLLYKGTHDDPARRFHSAEELEEQLKGVLRLCEGGVAGVPIGSRKFISAVLTNTGRLGRRGETTLDEQDRTVDTMRYGDQALQIGNYAGASNFYRQAVQTNPQSIDAYVRLVDVLIEGEDFENAKQALSAVQRSAPNHWKVLWSTARLCEAQGKWAEAANQYRELVMELPGELPPLQALARAYEQQGNDDEAIRLYGSILRADPGNVDAVFGITPCLLKQQRWGEAIQYLSSINEASAKYADAQLLLCDIYVNHAAPALPGVQDIQSATQTVKNLKGRIDDARYYLVRAETYYVAWHMARNGMLPATTAIPDVLSSFSLKATARSLGSIAEESYKQYLLREQHLVPRADVIQRRYEVAPWHIL